MAAVQKLGATSSSAGMGFGAPKAEEDVPDRFPAGLRVLVVDDDSTCLKILEQMLRKCEYTVTICSRATNALSLLRERKGHFDLVISDVHMPDMDGFKLLEHVGLEMDLPVIMMSADSRTSMVMKGIKHGACDYLIKPVRFEELRNIWQHIVRKKWNDNKDHEHSGSIEESDKLQRDDVEYASSANDNTDGNLKSYKKKRDLKEDVDEGELENDDPSTSKKPRVVWSVELHQQFVSAVNQLGIDKAVPKRILELMNVPGLTRENVASHLQKYRLYLKRLSGVAQHQGGLPNSFSGAVETNPRVGPVGRLDLQSLAASGQIPPQTLAALHAELLGRPSSCVVLPSLEQPVLHSSLQGSKCMPAECGITFGRPLMKCQSSILKQLPESNIAIDDVSSGYGTWVPNLGTVNNTGFNGLTSPQNGNMMAQMFQQQQQQQSHQPVLSETSHAINAQPPLIVPSQASTSFQVGNNSVPISQNTLLVSSQLSNSFQTGNTLPVNQHSSYSNPRIIVDHNPISSQSKNMSMSAVVDADLKNAMMLNGYPVPGSISSAVHSCLIASDSGSGWGVATSDLRSNPVCKLSGFMPDLLDIQSSSTQPVILPDQGQGRNLGFVGKGTCIPSRFAVDDVESIADNLSQKDSSILDDGSRVKQEIYLDFVEGSVVGNTALSHHPASDLMSILSK